MHGVFAAEHQDPVACLYLRIAHGYNPFVVTHNATNGGVFG